MRSTLGGVLTALALAAGLCGPLRGQSGPAPSFGETIAVRVVNVDVWVFDEEGRPVEVAQDADGGRSGVRQGLIQLARDAANHEVGARVSLRRGRNRIVVGVRDEIGEVLSVVGLEVEAGSS